MRYPIMYYLSAPADKTERATASSIVSGIRDGFSGPAMRDIGLVNVTAERRRWFAGLGYRSALIAVVTVETGEVNSMAQALIDSIVFGAMKRAAGQGWSVLDIRTSLNRTGSDSVRRITGDIGEIRRVFVSYQDASMAEGNAIARSTVTSATDQRRVGSDVNSSVGQAATDAAAAAAAAAREHRVTIIAAAGVVVVASAAVIAVKVL